MLLQGPVGPFFREVAEHLLAQGASVVKVNFNAADAWFFKGAPTLDYTGTFEDWPEYFERQLRAHAIDTVFMFGDSRRYHIAAAEVAKRASIDVRVFEEGYLRPDYITFERGGTNFKTTVPRSLDFYRNLSLPEPPRSRSVGVTFWWVAWYAIMYSVVLTYFSARYPHYPHHRDMRAGPQALGWNLSAVRKVYHIFLDFFAGRRIKRHQGDYFLVPLQVHDDFQVKNSRFDDVRDFIEEVVASFADAAPQDAWLVFKHHPRDRGFRDYTRLLRDLAERHGLQNRIVYVHDVHLPTLLRRARGTVVINSTVGLSSLHHGTPVKCLERAVYDMFDAPQTLAEFWNGPEPVERALVITFIRWLKLNVLLNGTFYRPRFWPRPVLAPGSRNTPRPRSATLGK